jgi:hypothetical protein
LDAHGERSVPVTVIALECADVTKGIVLSVVSNVNAPAKACHRGEWKMASPTCVP